MTQSRFEVLLLDQDVILLDGAMGTLLIKEGLKPGECPDSWNISQPEKVRQVHRGYLKAGSRVILTNTFGGTKIRLKNHLLEDQAATLNREAAALARCEAENATHPAAVAGSIGPLGLLLKPFGPLEFNEARQEFKEQAQALEEGGVDIFWIETMSDVNEVRAAVDGIRMVSDLPIAITMSFDTKGKTVMGVAPNQAVKLYKELGAVAGGANCGKRPGELVQSISEMQAENPAFTLIAKANAGLPMMEKDRIVYNGSPEIMAEYALNVKVAGARLIGGCCGSTPDHILAMALALGIK